MEVKEQAERKIAKLHTRIQQLESHVNRLASDNAQLGDRLSAAHAAAAAAAAAPAPDPAAAAAAAAGAASAAEQAAALGARCSALEGELRKSKRREEKLQALLFRLREDLKAAGGDVARLDLLKDQRALEYELDRVQNRSSRDKAVLREKLQVCVGRVLGWGRGEKGRGW